MDYQLEPPDIHRRNSEKRSIRTWNNNVFSGLIGTYKLFPMHLWDILLYRSQITLNMLKPSRQKPNISAHAMMDRKCDFKENFGTTKDQVHTS